MRVAIAGPNLRDQSKGTFHVHSADCADLKRTNKEPEYADAWVIDASGYRDVTFAVYADHIAENFWETEDIDKLTDDEISSYINDFYYFPCCAKEMSVA